MECILLISVEILLHYRVVLSATGVAEQEHGLLQPISLDISVKRNLTISWYKKKPELEIQAMLKPIKVVGSLFRREHQI